MSDSDSSSVFEPRRLTLLVAFAGGLAAAALIGLAWAAGIGRVLYLLVHPHWLWLGVAVVGELVAYAGYTAAYREIARAEGGAELEVRKAAALVAAGFGVFVHAGGFALDREALRRSGLSSTEARPRVRSPRTCDAGRGGPRAVLAPIGQLEPHGAVDRRRPGRCRARVHGVAVSLAGVEVAIRRQAPRPRPACARARARTAARAARARPRGRGNAPLLGRRHLLSLGDAACVLRAHTADRPARRRLRNGLRADTPGAAARRRRRRGGAAAVRARLAQDRARTRAARGLRLPADQPVAPDHPGARGPPHAPRAAGAAEATRHVGTRFEPMSFGVGRSRTGRWRSRSSSNPISPQPISRTSSRATNSASAPR